MPANNLLQGIFSIYRDFFEAALVASGYERGGRSSVPVLLDYSQAPQQKKPYGVIAWDSFSSQEVNPPKDFSDGETVLGPVCEWTASLTFAASDPLLPVELLSICSSASASEFMRRAARMAAEANNVSWPGFLRGISEALAANEALPDQTALYVAAGTFSFSAAIPRKFSSENVCVEDEASLPDVRLALRQGGQRLREFLLRWTK